MIPAIIVPTLNQPNALQKMILSINRDTEKIIIIDNGGLVTRDLISHDDPVIKIIHVPHNLGVAASWNLGVKSTPHADWWLICNDDIEFGSGDLERLEQTVDPNIPMLYFMLGMAAFAVTPSLIDQIGWFDEGFVNAYDEDLDFARRCRLAGIEPVEVGWNGKHIGSATIYADQDLRDWNHRSHGMNDRYYALKWGGSKEGGERDTVPFGGRYVEPGPRMSRLRAQTWPRPK